MLAGNGHSRCDKKAGFINICLRDSAMASGIAVRVHAGRFLSRYDGEPCGIL